MDKELQLRQKLKDDFIFYAENCLKITPKLGGISKFKLNKAQRYLHGIIEKQRRETGNVRVIVLKGRQQGISTYVEGRFFWRVTHRKGVNAFILTHNQGATNNLFKLAKRYYNLCPDAVRPHLQRQNEKELSFDLLDSGYKVGTAGNKEVGRSATTQYFHGSEVAFWDNAGEHASGIMQTISGAAETEVILESTARGVGNYFHLQWQMAEKGLSKFIPVFIPWFWQDEYVEPVPAGFESTTEEVELVELYGLTKEQLMFRRGKVIEFGAQGRDGAIAFKQEYPCNANEAFHTSSTEVYIKPECVIRAQRNQNVEKSGAKCLGVDVARFGDDKTALIRRQGRAAWGLETYTHKDAMEVAGLVYSAHKKENFDYIFIDVVGIGAGVFDRLNELLGSTRVLVPVNAGEKRTLYRPDQYYNKRAEMWGEVNAWLNSDLPVSLPDKEELLLDLCGQKYDFTSINQLKLVSKKNDSVSSPDTADALCLTFSLPAEKLLQKHDKVVDTLMKYAMMG